RYGAAAPAGDGEPWQSRFQRLLQSSTVPFVAPLTVDPTTTEIDHTGAAEQGEWSGDWTVSDDYLLSDDFSTTPKTRPLTDLVAGQIYNVTAGWVANPVPVSMSIDAPVLDATSAYDEDSGVVIHT